MMKPAYTLILCAAVLASACSKEDTQSAAALKTEIPATIRTADNTESRALWDETHTIWEESDKIGLAVASNENREFTAATLSEDARNATFAGTLSETVSGEQTVWAKYPYDANDQLTTTSVTAAFGEQTHRAAGGYKLPFALGYFKGDAGTDLNRAALRFQSPFATLKLQIKVTDATTFNSISFSGNNGELISGKVNFDLADDGTATFDTSYAEMTGTTVVLDCGELAATANAVTTFYISVPAIDYTQGYTIIVTTDRGAAMQAKVSGADYSATQNKIVTMPEFTLIPTTNWMPDSALRSALKSLGLIESADREFVTPTQKGINATTIDVSENSAITSMVGIELFQSMQTLSCYSCNFTSLDVSKCSNLEKLYCGCTDLVSLTLPSGGAFSYLDCSDSNLTSVDVSKCDKLGIFGINNNPNLATLILPDEPGVLSYLTCNSSALTSLDVSKYTKLEQLYCNNSPKLATLTLPAAGILSTVSCENSKLRALDITKMAAPQNPDNTPMVLVGNQSSDNGANGFMTLTAPAWLPNCWGYFNWGVDPRNAKVTVSYE